MAGHFWYPDDRISPDSDDAFTQAEIDEIVELIRESSFLDDESGASIDERMTEVFGGDEPEWSGFQTYQGFCCVNCGGVMTNGREKIGLVIQFEVANDFESFVLSGMLVNGVEQPEGLILQFEEQFATDLWEDEIDCAEDIFSGYDPKSRFAHSGYSEWEESALWENETDEEDDYEEDCGCGHDHHHHRHHHHHGEEEVVLRPLSGDDDDDEGDYVPDWGDDAAERFWYGSDDDDWQDDEGDY